MLLMKEIQMVDLRSQYQKIKTEIDDSIAEVINSTAFINGAPVKFFQEELGEYLRCVNVIGCANGTDALQVALMALDLQPGDEVITTNFTFVSTVEILCLLGLKPVIVDIQPDTFNIDPGQIKKYVTDKTRAIIPVHLFGQCAHMHEIVKIAEENNLYIIEDTAQALGADYTFPEGSVKRAGTIGAIGCTSLFPSKNLGAFGDGGAIFTDDDDLARKIRSIVNHGQKVRYEYESIGVNSRLDTLQAAILRVKLQHLDEYKSARNRVAEFYDNAFENIEELSVPFRASYSSHVFHQYTLTTNGISRDDLKEHLEARGIPAMVYYPIPIHAQNAYKYLGYTDDAFPHTVDLCKRVLSLPMHTELDEAQLEFITTNVLNYITKYH